MCTQSRSTGGPDLTHSLSGIHNLGSFGFEITGFLYLQYITMIALTLYAPVKYSGDLCCAHVGSATVYREGLPP
jgi:hypothetical protein